MHWEKKKRRQRVDIFKSPEGTERERERGGEERERGRERERERGRERGEATSLEVHSSLIKLEQSRTHPAVIITAPKAFFADKGIRIGSFFHFIAWRFLV